MQCNYHPTQPAWWQCNRCNKALCPQCIIQRKGGFQESESIYLCPKCHVPAVQLDMGHIIDPFWKRLHKCFVYPFSSMTSVLLIFGLALLSVFFSRPGLFSAIIRFVLWAVMVKYSYEALRTTAEGRFNPPPLSAKALSDDFHIVFKQIALFIALILIFVFFVAKLGPVAWVLFTLAVVVGLPAMIIILAINDDLGQALNPVYFIGMALRIGWGYLLLFFFLSILLSAPGVLAYLVIRHMPEALQFFLWYAAKNYYTLVSYHLMGYVILQYHERLEHHVDMDTLLASTYPAGLPKATQGHAAPSPDGHHAALLNEVSLLIQEGELDGATALIQQRTKLDIDNLDLSSRYVQLLQKQKRTGELLQYAPRHLDLLAKADQKDKAISLYLACSQIRADFAPSATALFKIGGWLNEKGRVKEAIMAFNRLTKIHPRDALVPKTYYRAAQLLHEQLRNTEKAKKVLQALIQKYPDHDIANFARNYLGTL